MDSSAHTDRLGRRIAGARIEADLTQAELAAAAGVKTIQTVGNWEGGRSRPSLEVLRRIAEITKRPVPWFLQDENEPDASLAAALDRTARLLEEYRAREAATGLPAATVTLPVLGSVAAGNWQEAVTHAGETYDYPASEFPPDMARDAAFLLRISGDSMINAGIMNGDLILVQPTPDYQEGEIVIVTNGGEATCKYVSFAGPDRTPILLAANPAYPPLLLPEGTRIIGVARGVTRKIGRR